jgi:prepilin-type N-terminal cleavage/methylation domain-containing protein/prepilin-type processing-associated H-X9-DG protein
MMMATRKKGFTLIELLVVVAIIAVLVAMLLPSLRIAREMAKQTVCLSHIKQIDMAVNMYADDNREWIVHYACWPPFSNPPSGPNFHYDWPSYYAKYVGLDSHDMKTDLPWQASPIETVFYCPSHTTYSYGMNTDIGGDVRPGVHHRSWEQNPEYTLRMAEPSHLKMPSSWCINYSYCFNPLDFENRHRGGSLYLFCDGHVEWLKFEGWFFGWNTEKHRIQDH